MYFISLGLGSPARITEFILFGLSPNPGAASVLYVTLNTRSLSLTLDGRSPNVTLSDRSTSLTLPALAKRR